jgi:hypothetical protein
MHPSSSRAFQRDQERDLKLAGLMDLISTNKTKQNKQTTSFIDRYHGYISQKQFFVLENLVQNGRRVGW